MRIPTHQIHNVLNAYVRCLKIRHGACAGNADDLSDDRTGSPPADTDRRWIMDKLSSDIIHRILRSGPEFQPDPSQAGPESETPAPSNPPEELIRYHVLMPDGRKISQTIQIQDPDFLIRQIEEIARNGQE